MKYPVLLLFATSFVLSSCASPEPHEAYFEIRLPKGYGKSSGIVGDVEISSGSGLARKPARYDAATNLISFDDLVWAEGESYVELALDDQPSKIYPLQVPKEVTDVSWSGWMAPAGETERGFAMSHVHGRSKQLSKPKNGSEYLMRVRYEKWESTPGSVKQ